MIKVYPTEVEAIHEDGGKVFTMMMIDDVSATIEMNATVGLHDHGADDLYDALKRSIEILRTEK